MTDNSLLRDFITETGEHLEELKTKLSELEQQPDDVTLMNDIFRSIHTIKGSAEYLGLENLAVLSHKLESLLDLMRRGECAVNKEILGLLNSANERIDLLINDLIQYEAEKNSVADLINQIKVLTGEPDQESTDAPEAMARLCEGVDENIIYGDEHDEELFEIFIDQLKDGLRGLCEEIAQLKVVETVEPVLEQCVERITALRSSANYMGYDQLKDHYETWLHQVAEVRDQLANGNEVDIGHFIDQMMVANIARVKGFFPKADGFDGIGVADLEETSAATNEGSEIAPTIEESDEESGFDISTQGLLADFITETSEHLESTESNLLRLEQQPDDIDLMNEIFRSIHTIKGSSEYLGLTRISELSHKLESLLDLLRRGERKSSKEVVELLIGANDRIAQLVDDLEQHQSEKTQIEDLLSQLEKFTQEKVEIQENQTEIDPSVPGSMDEENLNQEEHDEELYGIFLEQLKEGLQGLYDEVKQLGAEAGIESGLETCAERLSTLRSSANYMGYEQLKEHYESWIRQVEEVRSQLAGNQPVDIDRFLETVMQANIKRVEKFFPNEELLAQADAAIEQEPEPSNERSAETEQENIVPAEPESVASSDQENMAPAEPESVAPAEEETYFDMGSDSLLADFIAETGEHLDDTEQNLLLLEQDPDNIELLNEIFRSVHTIKGSSEYLGLVRIAELSHKLESLLDRLRRSELEAGKKVVELLIEANDRISQLVDDLDQHKAEHAEISDLLCSIDQLIFENNDQQAASEPSMPQVVKFDHGMTVYEETYDQELFDIFLKHLKEGMQSLSELLKQMRNSSAPLEQLMSCIETVGHLCSSANYMEYEELKAFFDRWLVTLKEMQEKLIAGDSVDFNAFLETSIKTNIDTVYGIFNEFLEPHTDENKKDAEINDEIDVEQVYDDVTANSDEFAEMESSDSGLEEASDQAKDPSDDHDLIERLENAFDARLGIGGEREEPTLPFDIEGQLLSEHQEGYSDETLIGETSDLNYNVETYEAEPDTLEAFLLSEAQKPTDDMEQEDNRVEGDDENKGLISENFMQEVEVKETQNRPSLADVIEEVPQIASEPETSTIEEKSDRLQIQPVKPEEIDIESYSPSEQESGDRRRSYQLGRRKTDKFRERLMKQSIRVEAGKIDYLMNQVGELVVNRAGFAQIFTDMQELQLFLKQTQKLDKKEMQLVKDLTNRISDATLTLGRVTSELQENVMKVRMLPIAQLFSRYPRLVHDLIRNTNKKVNLDVRGEETELDKMVIEQIADPMVHVIRNAVDHGIEEVKERQRRGKSETGTLRLEAYHEGNYVVIEIGDDGRGINIEKVKDTALKNNFITQEELNDMDEQEVIALIMRPGFSTADAVTHTSGRGVGMDVVKDHIEKLSGTIDIQSTPGLGVRIRIKIPLTLAIIPALMVTVANEIFTIPLAAVDETLRVHRNDISSIEGLEVVYLRDATIPLIRLDEVFKMENTVRSDEFFVVIVNTGAKKVGFIVDQLRGREEVVIKPLEDYLQEKSGFSGATILGDGSISLILDVFELVTLSINQHSNKIRAVAV